MKADFALAEYASLRDEIIKKMELCINLSTFSATATVTLYALAISAGQAEMFLLPLVILAPASRRIASYKKAMVKLGTYISVFIEQDCFGRGWETRNTAVSLERAASKTGFMEFVRRLSDTFLLATASLFVYAGSKLAGLNLCKLVELDLFKLAGENSFSLALFIVGVVLYLMVFEARRRVILLDDERSRWLDKWQKRLEEERAASRGEHDEY